MQLKRWSHSTVKDLLEGCPWKVYLERFQGLRPQLDHPRSAVGTALHAAVEAHEEARRLSFYSNGRIGNPAGVPEDRMLTIAVSALDECAVDWAEHDYGEVLEELQTALNHWWRATIPAGQSGAGKSIRDHLLPMQPVAVERTFQLWSPHTARPIGGAPDEVCVDRDGLLVVDTKQARDWRRYSLDGKHHRLQAAQYSRAVVEAVNLPGLPGDRWPRVEFHVPRVRSGERADFEAVRVVSVQPDDSDMAALDQRMRDADRQVAAGDFPKNPSWFMCQPAWCPHHQDAGGTCNPEGPPEFTVDVAGEPLPMVET